MSLYLLGLNHKTAPVAVREKLALPPSKVAGALRFLRDNGAREAAILSTCNRAEIYAIASPESAPQLERFLVEYGHLPPDESRHLYRFHDAESARHLFRVASGVDSLVLGESEILGQVKAALSSAREHGAMGAILDELFRRAIGCGKRARSETAIGRGALNVGSAAVELARQIFGPLQGHTVLILGAGKMSSLTAQHLVASGARRILVANRTYERARELAQTFSDQSGDERLLSGIPNADAHAVTWDEFPSRLVEADIVISSTRAPHLVLGAEQVATAMKARRQRPLFLIDIAVPRDIDPHAHQLDNVFLYDIDDLQGVVAANRAQRAQELGLVETIVEGEVLAWQKWIGARDSQPTLAALAQHANAVRDREIAATLAQLDHLSPRDRQIVESLGRSVAGKLMHAPLRHLRENSASQPDDSAAIARAFGLNGAPNDPDEESNGGAS